MRPGRLPQDHPLEQRARDQLRNLSATATAKARQDPQLKPKPAPQQPVPTRWH